MDSTLWVFVYSQYSPSCLKLMQMIDQSGLDITFQVLSIDDKNMRERIKRDTRYNIRYVPCILKIDKNNGIASQFEAEYAFNLIENEIQTMIAFKKQNNMMSTPTPPQQRVSRQPAQVSIEMIEDELPMTQPTSINPQALNSQAHSGNNIPKATPIEELMDLSELEGPSSQFAPPESIANDRPMGERRNVEKISVASVMAGRESMDINGQKPVPEMDIKPVKTGQKVNVNDIMAGKQ